MALLEFVFFSNNNDNDKMNCRIVNLAVQVDHRVKLKESEKRDKNIDLGRELKKKNMDHESDGDTNRNRCARYCGL